MSRRTILVLQKGFLLIMIAIGIASFLNRERMLAPVSEYRTELREEGNRTSIPPVHLPQSAYPLNRPLWEQSTSTGISVSVETFHSKHSGETFAIRHLRPKEISGEIPVILVPVMENETSVLLDSLCVFWAQNGLYVACVRITRLSAPIAKCCEIDYRIMAEILKDLTCLSEHIVEHCGTQGNLRDSGIQKKIGFVGQRTCACFALALAGQVLEAPGDIFYTIRDPSISALLLLEPPYPCNTSDRLDPYRNIRLPIFHIADQSHGYPSSAIHTSFPYYFYRIHSSNQFFLERMTGSYEWNPRMLSSQHVISHVTTKFWLASLDKAVPQFTCLADTLPSTLEGTRWRLLCK